MELARYWQVEPEKEEEREETPERNFLRPLWKSRTPLGQIKVKHP